MKKRYVALAAFLISTVMMGMSFVGTASAISYFYYSVGGEIIPLNIASYLISPTFLTIVAVMAVLVIAGIALAKSPSRLNIRA